MVVSYLLILQEGTNSTAKPSHRVLLAVHSEIASGILIYRGHNPQIVQIFQFLCMASRTRCEINLCHCQLELLGPLVIGNITTDIHQNRYITLMVKNRRILIMWLQVFTISDYFQQE